MGNEFGEVEYGSSMDFPDMPEISDVSEISELTETHEPVEESIFEDRPDANEAPEDYPEPEIIEETEITKEPEAPEELEPLEVTFQLGEDEISEAVDSIGHNEFGEVDYGSSMDLQDVPEIPDVSEIPELTEVHETVEESIFEGRPGDNEAPEDYFEPEIIEEAEITEEPEAPEELEPPDVTFQLGEDEISEVVDSIGQIENLNPGVWDSLDPEERVQTLQEIEDRMAEIQERPSVTIVKDDTLDENVFGGYDCNSSVIVINANHLSSEMPVDEFIDTIVHEGRHAYQDYAINNPGFVNNTELVNSWAENRKNILSADEYGQEIYATQPVEADAWNYATTIRNNLIANNWSKS